MVTPDGDVVTIVQADTWIALSILPMRIHGIVTIQCPRTNDPVAGVKLIMKNKKNDASYPGLEMGPLDSQPLQHNRGVDLSEWGIKGSHVGDQVVIAHGGAG